MNIKKTEKGYFYDTRRHKRISEKEYQRRLKISKSIKESRKEIKPIEDVFEDIMEEFEIAEDDIQTGTP